MERISRRKLTIIALSPLGLLACSKAPQPLPDPKTTIAPTNPIAEPVTGLSSDLKTKLLGTLNKPLLEEVVGQLLPSIYSQYIKGAGLAFFRSNTPSEVAFADIAMPLYPSRIETERADTFVSGLAMMRNFKNPTELTIASSRSFSLPVPYVIAGNQPLITEIDVEAGQTYRSGLSPQISIRYPKEEDIEPKLKSILPEILAATMIKEVASIGMVASYMQVMATFIRANNLEYLVQTKESGTTEIFSHLVGNLIANEGKLNTLLDWSPVVVMVKAFSRQRQIIEAMRSYSSMTRPIDAILSTDFGKIEDLIPNTFAWCIRNRSLMEAIPHKGNFDRLP